MVSFGTSFLIAKNHTLLFTFSPLLISNPGLRTVNATAVLVGGRMSEAGNKER